MWRSLNIGTDTLHPTDSINTQTFIELNPRAMNSSNTKPNTSKSTVNPHANPSASVLSLASTAGSTSSTTPLTRAGKGKDYSAAFGSLTSTYGTSGTTPKPHDPSLPRASASSSAAPAPRPAPSQAGAPPKDYEAAFANLSQSYGYSGAPALPRKDPAKKGAERTGKMSLLGRG